MKTASQFFWFCLAGMAGFFVDAGLLYLLKDSLGLFAGRDISFVAAVFTTWVINRSCTFDRSHSNQPPAREFVMYLGLMFGGGVVNYGLYAFLVSRFVAVADHPILGVVAGTLAGMTINFCTSKFVLFRFERR